LLQKNKIRKVAVCVSSAHTPPLSLPVDTLHYCICLLLKETHPSPSSFLRTRSETNPFKKKERSETNKKKKQTKRKKRDGDGERGEEARGRRGTGGGLGEGVRGVRGGGRRGGARRRARRVRGRDQGGADGAQDHLHREEGGPRRHVPQRRLHPVQGTAARLHPGRVSLHSACAIGDLGGWASAPVA
jgi:hypothetical protein